MMAPIETYLLKSSAVTKVTGLGILMIVPMLYGPFMEKRPKATTRPPYRL